MRIHYNSNCLIEAIRFKFRLNCKIYIKFGRLNSMPHFYWKYDKCYYHFCADNKNLSCFNQLYFKGSIKQFYYHE